MKPVFVIEKEERDDGSLDVGLSFEKGSDAVIAEALFMAAKSNDNIFRLIEAVHSRLRSSSFEHGHHDVKSSNLLS